MTFQPVVPFGGYTGWRFLQRTLEPQKEAFNANAALERDAAYFRENIGNVETPSDIVNDFRLLKVALGAFGLDQDLNRKYLIEKVLSEGTANEDSLANRFADKRYAELSNAFGFDSPIGVKTKFSLFSDDILARYENKQFQIAVGNTNPDMRLALNVGEGLTSIMANSATEKAQWFSMMGNPPLRQVFERALGFAPQIGALDLDLQLDQFQTRAKAVFGTDSFSEFMEPGKQEELVRMFLIRSEASSYSAANTRGQIALSLLSAI